MSTAQWIRSAASLAMAVALVPAVAQQKEFPPLPPINEPATELRHQYADLQCGGRVYDLHDRGMEGICMRLIYHQARMNAAASCGVSQGCSVKGVVHPGLFRHAVGGKTYRTEEKDGPSQECPKLPGESSPFC